ncbi:8385_t:CDS:2 [Funneliformis mosseae]|uniref:8385_t:CDS:1 n=1 Tax=Funneliformis mosseae TaxID=27381 RepID=A0A9N9G608_FUNMO|nr:8385_t:CDS:2 [Funneliformis mosseae]
MQALHILMLAIAIFLFVEAFIFFYVVFDYKISGSTSQVTLPIFNLILIWLSQALAGGIIISEVPVSTIPSWLAIDQKVFRDPLDLSRSLKSSERTLAMRFRRKILTFENVESVVPDVPDTFPLTYVTLNGLARPMKHYPWLKFILHISEVLSTKKKSVDPVSNSTSKFWTSPK